MKNKIKCLFLLILIVPCMFLFSACGGKVVVGFEKSTASTAFSDVYTITYNDGTSDSFSVSHGEDGEDLDIIDIYNVAKSEGAFSGSFSEFLELYLTFDLNVTDDRAAINKSLMSVVSIYSEFYYEKDNYINTIKDTAVGNGSGVVYKLDKTSGDAYIITNYHVIYLANEKSGAIADNICCALYGNKIEFDWKTNYDGSYVKNSDGYPMVEYSGEMIDCEFVGGSMLYDIAVIKISGSDIVKNSGLLEAKIANSDDVVVGQTAIAIGNPQNLGICATQGIVSVDSEYTITQMANGSYVESRLMRVDTPINAGNSGGGLFNSNGELIGIVNAKLVDEEIENIGYAIPSNIAKNVADSIFENSVNGDARPKRAIMGITPEIGKVTSYYDEELERAVIKEEVLISKVHDNSLAKDAGLKVGYKILSITLKGKTYQITRLHQVIDLSWLLQVGDVVKFEIEGKTDKINIIITEDCFEYMD